MNQDSATSTATIGRTTRVVGRVHGDGDLIVEGQVQGELTLKGHLHVAPGGIVSAPVDVGDLTLEGGVDGDVVAHGAVVLRQGSALRGAIHATRFAIEDGARFSGKIEMPVDLPDELTSAVSPKNSRK